MQQKLQDLGKNGVRGIILKNLVGNTLKKDRSPLKMKMKWKEMKKEGKNRMSIGSVGKAGLLYGEKWNWIPSSTLYKSGLQMI